MISQVTAETLPHVWGTLRREIRKGLSHGQGDGASGRAIYRDVLTGDSTMWVVHEGEEIQATVVFSVIDGETKRKLFIELLAGRDMGSWVTEVERLLQEYRDRVGAACIEASCRPGLAKYLRDRGWRQKAVVIEL